MSNKLFIEHGTTQVNLKAFESPSFVLLEEAHSNTTKACNLMNNLSMSTLILNFLSGLDKLK